MAANHNTPLTLGRNEHPMLFSTAYSRLLAHELALDEQDWPQLLTGTAISPALLQDTDAFFSLPEQKTIIHNALSLANAPGLGLRLGSKLHLLAHGPLGIAASSASSLGEGVNVMLRFQRTRAQFVTILLLRQPHLHARFVCHLELDAVGVFLMEAMASSFRCSLDFLLGQVNEPLRYDFEFAPPPHADLYPVFLKADCHFNQPYTSIRLPGDILQRRTLFADAELHRQALQQCQRIEQELKRQQSLADQIRKRIRQQEYRCTLDDMAGQFNMCPRTLIRRLKKEDTSFKEILEQELQTAATDYLSHSTLSVDSIAQLLGYSQTINFRRACQRWFGATPSEFRQQAQKG